MVYQISSGQGPAECELAVAKLLGYLQRNHAVSVLDTTTGYYEGTYRSVRLSTEEDLSDYLGSVQWVCKSPYRPTHKRKNWFIDFSRCGEAEKVEFDPEQVVFETFRSGGKGGQNVNKVETGVRATYLPTGESVVCTEERSQYANKQKAITRLQERVSVENRRRRAGEKSNAWRKHTMIKRGNARTVFVGSMFKSI